MEDRVERWGERERKERYPSAIVADDNVLVVHVVANGVGLTVIKSPPQPPPFL